MPKVSSSSGYAFLGIDPGKQGGIAWIVGSQVTALSMPDTELGIWNVLEGLIQSDSPVCIGTLEKVHSMPQQGVASTFTFGCGYGALKMGLIAAGISHELVTPQAWQKALAIPPRKKDEDKAKFKKRLRSHAQRLYPGLEVWKVPRTEGLQLAISDALLLAHYTKLKYEGVYK